jgi:NADPH:quinone reductase-like Zn-dependent oxidoreductase
MKAIQYRAYGGYSENRLVDLPQPPLKDGEVLVAMRTVGVNPLDNTFRSGHHYGATPENLPRIGGQTGAGTVVASKSDAFKIDDRVFVRVPGFGITADGFPAASMTITPGHISRVGVI